MAVVLVLQEWHTPKISTKLFKRQLGYEFVFPLINILTSHHLGCNTITIHGRLNGIFWYCCALYTYNQISFEISNLLSFLKTIV